MVKNIHLITYAEGKSINNGNEYSVTQNLLLDSIGNKTKYNVIFHNYNLSSIKNKNWFRHIEDFPNFNLSKNYPHAYQYPYWHRNGYFNAWKPFLIKEVYEIMGDDDIIYYVDSSGYHQIGFEENIDALVDFTYNNKNVCGSFGFDVLNNSYNCCDEFKVWSYIFSNSVFDFQKILNKPHILNSWFLFNKSEDNKNFINEWVSLIMTKIDNLPIVTYHHTVDQSIFNILVYKYGFKSFYNKRPHDDNKNHNLVHFELSSKSKDEIDNYFINPINFSLC